MAVKKNKKHTLLWRIEHEDIKSPSYLFGTMHVRDSRAFKGLEQIKQYINQCEAFASEYDVREANQQRFSDVLQMPEGQSYAQLFKPKVLKKLAKVFYRETGMELEPMSFLKPIALSNILAERQLERQEPDSLDDTLYQFAETQRKAIIGLETFEEQIAVLERIPMESQVRSLLRAATDFAKVRRQIQKSVEAYCSGDVLKIYKTVKKANSREHKILLKGRNKIMAERAWAAMQEQSIFVAVGAAHLGGKVGLLAEMRRRGCVVVPI